MFDAKEGTGVSIAVLLWGKGSGKDYLTSILQLYCIYVILCLRDPQEYFGQAPGEPLDVVNVAYNANQAKNVYFTKFLERLKRCGWFKRHFDLVQSGRLLERRKSSSWGEIHIATTIVTFPSNVRAISESSENESYEGYNIIVWIMDEASAFKSAKKIENAHNIYNTLKSSANTRFGNRWLGFVLSYPRKEDEWDFTTRLYKEALGSKTMYPSREFSWNVAPASLYPSAKFRFIYDRPDQHIEIDVPESLREEFEKYPEESLGKYCCMPGRSRGSFIEQPGAIPRVMSNRKPIFTTEVVIVENRSSDGELLFRGLGHRIVSWNVSGIDKQYKYVIHVDCGLTDDRAAVVVAHGEPILLETESQDGKRERTWTQKVVEDAHVIYEPDKKRDLRVSLQNIESLILDIASNISVVMVTYDHWQSARSVETLAMEGITTKEHNVNRDDYNLLRGIIYSGDIDLLLDPLTELELIQLQKTNSGGVDHPEGGSKDLTDALAGVTRLVLREDSVLKKQMRAQNVGLPRPTAAFAHKVSGSDFNIGPFGEMPRLARTPQKETFGIPNISIPDIPPLPFGIGAVDRPRPQTRALFSDKRQYTQNGLADSAIASRIQELK
jgi:hypothetical protein